MADFVPVGGVSSRRPVLRSFSEGGSRGKGNRAKSEIQKFSKYWLRGHRAVLRVLARQDRKMTDGDARKFRKICKT